MYEPIRSVSAHQVVLPASSAFFHVAALFRKAEYHADHVRQGLPDHPYP
jgi:hypothetical protein